MNFIGIIPARYASTRFPGKPLAMLGGKTVIERVYRQAKQALDKVVVATDDERIREAVIAFGGEVVMTRADHPCGTNRCLEAYQHVKEADDKTCVVINIQGDEPFIQPEQIEAVKHCFDDPTCEIATLYKAFTEDEGMQAVENVNHVKVVIGGGKALYFSRSVIPYKRNQTDIPYYKHIGLYAYRADVLEAVVALPQSPLEKTESLEQLRWLENGYTIRAAETNMQTIGIDTPEDLRAAEAFLAQRG